MRRFRFRGGGSAISTLIAYILGDGIIFAADRNIRLLPPDGAPSNQFEGRKIHRWPNGHALVGYVGAAEVAGETMEACLQTFIRHHPVVEDPSLVAHDLRNELQAAMGRSAPPSSVVFAAFARREGLVIPEYWHITNDGGMRGTKGPYHPANPEFGCTEELANQPSAEVAPGLLRSVLQKKADAYDPQWFHHSIKPDVFNELAASTKAAFRGLHDRGLLSEPRDLMDWEKHASYWVLQFAAYFAAFYPYSPQYVGGVDVLSIPWPA